MKESQPYDRKSIRTVTGKTADFDEIAKDCVAFANRDGGHLDIGIEDDDELPPPEQKFPESLKETVVRRINERTYNVALVPNIKTAENAKIKAVGVTWGFRSYDELSALSPFKIIDKTEDISKLF